MRSQKDALHGILLPECCRRCSVGDYSVETVVPDSVWYHCVPEHYDLANCSEHVHFLGFVASFELKEGPLHELAPLSAELEFLDHPGV